MAAVESRCTTDIVRDRYGRGRPLSLYTVYTVPEPYGMQDKCLSDWIQDHAFKTHLERK
jgi:hypothetical protein